MTTLPNLMFFVAVAAAPAPAAPDSAALHALLLTFLDGAGRPGAAVHERFWADDLIYTGSSGRRVSKADILRDVRSAPDPVPGEPTTTYGAEDVRIQQYGDAALVGFRLVATTDDHGRTQVARYLNTGTLLKRGGEWRAVGWQATRMPFTEDERQRTVGLAAREFWRAMAAADTTALASFLDDHFTWSWDGSGMKWDRARFLAAIARREILWSDVAEDPAFLSRGETAVSGGLATVRVGTKPAPQPSPGKPVRVACALTLVREGGGWIVLALTSASPS